MKKIILTKGRFALVDDKDFERLNKFKWCIRGNKYAGRRDGKTGQIVLMHQIINKTSQGFITDHINRNKLDNRRKNLRTVTASQNIINVGIKKNNTSGCIGVYRDKRYIKGGWYAQISYKGKRQRHLGLFRTKTEAIMARKTAEKLYHKI